jgi:hypothetical protein
MFFDSINVITRPKKNGVGQHWGVQFPEGYVYDYTAESGFRITNRHQFADGAQVTTVREIPWQEAQSVRARLDQVWRNPRRYDLLMWNCETFAEWLTSGVPKSAQVATALVGVGLLAFFLAAAR